MNGTATAPAPAPALTANRMANTATRRCESLFNNEEENESEISFDSDSSGVPSRLRPSMMDQSFLAQQQQQTTTPHRRIPSDPRDGIPVESSPQQQKRRVPSPQHFVSSCSPIPYSSHYYNRGSGGAALDDSPSVVIQRHQQQVQNRPNHHSNEKQSISSWMEAMLGTPVAEDDDAAAAAAQDETKTDDADSIDSVELLEQAALQIRTEIRQWEMLELADEAEIAAEAGFKKFAGRASTFGMNDLPEPKSTMKTTTSTTTATTTARQQYPLKRNSTYSEGTSGLSLLQRGSSLYPASRSKPKIRVLALRHIHEVIPQMSELHNHLKTHLTINGVNEQSLQLPEKVLERHDAVKAPVRFLNQFTNWVSSSPSKELCEGSSRDLITTPTPQEDNDSMRGDPGNKDSFDCYHVGPLLSKHIHAPVAVKRSPIRIPQGLELPDDMEFPIDDLPDRLVLCIVDDDDKPKPVHANDNDGDTLNTVPTSSSSQQGEEVLLLTNERSERNLADLQPVILFNHLLEGSDDNGDDVKSLGTGSSSSMALNEGNTPKPHHERHKSWSESSSSSTTIPPPPNVFVTPVRLRGMRNSTNLMRRSSFAGDVPKTDWRQGQPVISRTLRHMHSDPQGLVVRDDEDDALNIPILNKSEDNIVLEDKLPLMRRLNAHCTNDDSTESAAGRRPRILVRDEQCDASSNVLASMQSSLEAPRSFSAEEHTSVELVVEEGYSSSEGSVVGQTDAPLLEGKAVDLAVLNPEQVDAPPAMPLLATSLQAEAHDALVHQNGFKDMDTANAPVYENTATDNHTSTVEEAVPLMPLLESKVESPPDHSMNKHRRLRRRKSRSFIVTVTQSSSSVQSQSIVSDTVEERSAGGLVVEDEGRNDSGIVPELTCGTLESFERLDADLDGSHELRSSVVDAVEPLACHEPGPIHEPSKRQPQNRDEAVGFDDINTRRLGDGVSLSVDSFMEHAQASVLLEKNDAKCSSSIAVEEEAAFGFTPWDRQPVPKAEDEDDVRSTDSAKAQQAQSCEGLTAVTSSINQHVIDDQAMADLRLRAESTFRMDRDAEETKITDSLQLHSTVKHKMSSELNPSTAASSESIPTHARSFVLTQESDIGPPSGGSPGRLPRRTNSCPSLAAMDGNSSELVDISVVIPHKGLPHRTSGSTNDSEHALTGTRRRQLSCGIQALSMNPCQSASPITDTMDSMRQDMDNMMKRLSHRKSFDREREVREKNHDFLNNYLYCSKPPGQPSGEIERASFCGDIGFDNCEILSGLVDTCRSYIPRKPSHGKELLSLDLPETYHHHDTDTWFDTASEHFDAALEALVGSAHAQTGRWNSMFQAPSLRVKKDSDPPTPPLRRRQSIIIVQTSSKDSAAGDLSDQQFEVLYGMTREQFAELPVTDRSALHDMVHENRSRWASAIPNTQVPNASSALSVRSTSTTDIPNLKL